MATLKPIIRRPKAAEDVEGHAMYIADGSIDSRENLATAQRMRMGVAVHPCRTDYGGWRSFRSTARRAAPFDDRNSSPKQDHPPEESTAAPPDSSRERWQSHPSQTPQHEPTVP